MNAIPPLTDEDFTELLWAKGAPGAQGQEFADQPAIAVRLPKNPAQSQGAVLVFPGGGYHHHALGHEGAEIAAWLNGRGLAALVVRYRLGPQYKHPTMLWDAQRAIRTARARAGEWNIDPNKIGVWGFSAGGHLAATVSTHWDHGNPASADVVDRQSCRADFSILCYPVVTMHEWTHEGSKLYLLGEDPDLEVIRDLSNEMHVTANTPPAFLFHTADDEAVPDRNSVEYYRALRAANVPAELHIYEHGPHGVGLGGNDPVLASWPARLEDWLRRRAVL